MPRARPTRACAGAAVGCSSSPSSCGAGCRRDRHVRARPAGRPEDPGRGARRAAPRDAVRKSWPRGPRPPRGLRPSPHRARACPARCSPGCGTGASCTLRADSTSCTRCRWRCHRCRHRARVELAPRSSPSTTWRGDIAPRTIRTGAADGTRRHWGVPCAGPRTSSSPPTSSPETSWRRGAREGTISVIPLGSDILRDRDEDSASALLERLGVHGQFLLSVGTLEPRKNLPRLIEAYGIARRSLPEPWPLVVVGPPGWGPELEPREGVVFTGRVGDGTLASLYARARLLAYVPFEEGFGLPPVEAMHFGTPVVSSPLPTTGGAARRSIPPGSTTSPRRSSRSPPTTRCGPDWPQSGRSGPAVSPGRRRPGPTWRCGRHCRDGTACPLLVPAGTTTCWHCRST